MTEPSGRQKFLYYAFGVAPPVTARAWVERDLCSSAWRIRRAMQCWTGTSIGLALVVLVLGGVDARPWGVSIKGSLIGVTIGGFLGGILQATVMADYVRRRHLSVYARKWNPRADKPSSR